jgi:hypothetical protein
MLLALLALSSLVIVEAVFAQSIQKPSVPEFTVELVDNSYDVPSYDVPPTYGIDQYTGENITISEGYHVEGYHVENKTIEITVTNQPFVSSDEYTHFGYNVRVKGPFGESWTQLFPYTESQEVGPWNLRFQSASEYTVISIPQDYPSGGTVELQVEAVIAIGHPFLNTNFGYWEYLTSGWSNTKAITIGESQTITPSPVQTPTPEPNSTSSPEPATTTSPTPFPSKEPQSTEQAVILGLALTVAVLAVGLGLLVYFIKRK